MKKLVILFFLLLIPAQSSPEEDVALVLDDFHQAASVADGERYFSHFTENGIFLGTDMTERWTLEQFKEYASPHFKHGNGWTYEPVFREVFISPGGRTAWFDERLQNKNYGLTRGSGVLVLQNGRWRIAQYHLTLPVPNDLMKTLVEMIKDSD